jgi:hypothetical protein
MTSNLVQGNKDGKHQTVYPDDNSKTESITVYKCGKFTAVQTSIGYDFCLTPINHS